MALSRGTAFAIIAAVQKDKDCQERIQSVFGVMPAGYAGTARNIGMMAANAPSLWGLAGIAGGPAGMAIGMAAGVARTRDLAVDSGRLNPTNWLPTPGQDPYICVGIAEATRDAINAALRLASSGASLALIREADHADRDTTVGHAATGITMWDANRYIFDWHCTLRIDDPMIFPSQADWDRTENGVLFSNFSGFA